jgi:hypothetical protein
VFGDDVAKWLIEQLRRLGYETTDSPGQEDFGWYLNFKVNGAGHCFVVGYRSGGSNEEGVWIGWLERSRSLLPSILWGRKRGISPQAVNAIHSVLKGDPAIQNVHWHLKRDFDNNREELGASIPQ